MKLITPEESEKHAELLGNRCLKRFDHLHKKFSKQHIDSFRLYDWDIPEVRAAVDWYPDHLVLAEYERVQTDEPFYLPALAEGLAKKMKLPLSHVHIKRRRTWTGEDTPRYEHQGTQGVATGQRLIVQERDIKVFVNLDDFLDTGLYSDHRDTRVLVSQLAAGKDFLNLFAHTGAFTCAAAKAGAKSTTTVDRSATYLEWAKDNLALNGISSDQHTFPQGDTFKFLKYAKETGKRYRLAVVDPPSFFRDTLAETSFDINLDHPLLLSQVLEVMLPGSTVFFSTNHQRFEPQFEELKAKEIKEISPGNIPEDYRNRRIHRCWTLKT